MRKTLKEYCELLKNGAEQMRGALNLFFCQVVMYCELPFAVGIPNEETLAAVCRVRACVGLVEYDSFEDFQEDMKSA